jgi:DNA-binding MarR family transcriptional regulator
MTKPDHVQPVDSPERRRLPPLLRRAWYGLNQAFRSRIAPLGITPDQFTVLRTVLEHEPFQLTQSCLAAQMSSDPNTIASLMRRMERQGLIERRANARDRRVRALGLTAVGRRRYHAVRRRAVALQQRVLAVLPEGEREVFLAQLEVVADACRQAAQAGRSFSRSGEGESGEPTGRTGAIQRGQSRRPFP